MTYDRFEQLPGVASGDRAGTAVYAGTTQRVFRRQAQCSGPRLSRSHSTAKLNFIAGTGLTSINCCLARVVRMATSTALPVLPNARGLPDPADCLSHHTV